MFAKPVVEINAISMGKPVLAFQALAQTIEYYGIIFDEEESCEKRYNRMRP